MPKKITQPAKVSREQGGKRLWIVTCPMSRCKSFRREHSSSQGAHHSKAMHNREKHALSGAAPAQVKKAKAA